MKATPSTNLNSISTSVCRMDLKEGNLVFMYLFEDMAIEIPEIEEIYKNVHIMVNNQPYYLVIFTNDGNTSSQEARKYAAGLKGMVVAEALVIKSLSVLLLAKFYIKMNQPRSKIRIFSKDSEALSWINSIREAKTPV